MTVDFDPATVDHLPEHVRVDLTPNVSDDLLGDLRTQFNDGVVPDWLELRMADKYAYDTPTEYLQARVAEGPTTEGVGRVRFRVSENDAPPRLRQVIIGYWQSEIPLDGDPLPDGLDTPVFVVEGRMLTAGQVRQVRMTVTHDIFDEAL